MISMFVKCPDCGLEIRIREAFCENCDRVKSEERVSCMYCGRCSACPHKEGCPDA